MINVKMISSSQDPRRVAAELNAELARDLVGKMTDVGTTPRFLDGALQRRILVIYNPHSGNNRAGKVHLDCLLHTSYSKFTEFLPVLTRFVSWFLASRSCFPVRYDLSWMRPE